MNERQFCALWLSALWRAMAATGKGYRRYTLKNQPPSGAAGWCGERRKDKREGPLARMPKWMRGYNQRYAVA